MTTEAEVPDKSEDVTELSPAEMPQPLHGLRRWAMVSLGLLLVGIGILGAILPGLPSTVFLIGASYCFARSSPPLHRWLLNHPHLGPPLRAWHHDKSMSPRAKAMALAFMWTGVWISSVALTGRGPLIVVGLAIIGSIVVLFVVRTRSR